MAVIDKNEVLKCLNVLKRKGDLFEIRMVSGKWNSSGYFTDFDKAVEEIEKKFIKENTNIYIVLNNIEEACYSRKQHDMFIDTPANSTHDNDIVGYEWIMIDIDPKRPSGTSSSNEQLEKAKAKAYRIYKTLKQRSWYDPIIAMSGNGYHLLYKVSLRNCENNKKLVENVLKILGVLFDDEDSDIDKTTFNPSRICKLYGTYAKKGTDTKERPHRLSKIEVMPSEIKTNDIQIIKKFVENFTGGEKEEIKNPNYLTKKFDVEDFINKHHISVKEIKQDGGVTKYLLDECLFNSDHTCPDAAIFKLPNGALAYFCFHNSCSDKSWKDVRLMFEPDAYNKQYVKQEFKPNSKRQDYEIKKVDENDPVFKTSLMIRQEIVPEAEYIKTGITQLDRKLRGLKKGFVTCLSGLRACVDCDTEFFNGKGWKKISDYCSDDLVLQYNADGSAELVKPHEFIKEKKEKLWRIKTKHLDMCLSENHNVVYKTSKGNLAKRPLYEVMELHEKSKNGFSQKFITTFNFEGKGISLTDEQIRVMCMVICDGNLFDKRCRVNVKKERKKERCRKLLNDAKIEYSEKQYNPKDLEYKTFIFKPPLLTKEFDSFWYNCNKHQMNVILEEVVKWDGYFNRYGSYEFSQVNKNTIDFLQFCLACTGKRGGISIDKRINGIHKHECYTLNFCKGSTFLGILNSDKKPEFEEYKTKDGFMYCFRVPSGMLVLRRNNKIFVTGNCGKSSLISQITIEAVNQGYKVAMFSGELTNLNTLNWLVLQASGRDNVLETQYEGFYHATMDAQAKIDKWLDEKVYIYNNDYGNQFEWITEKLKEVVEEKKIDLVILDNLMALNINSLDRDKFMQQSLFVEMLENFAKQSNIHILFVAHPRKSNAFLRLDDVSGSNDIINRVDNAIILHRVNNDFKRLAKEMFKNDLDEEIYRCDNVIEICKDRDSGNQDVFIPLYFDKTCKRLCNYRGENKYYGWEVEG